MLSRIISRSSSSSRFLALIAPSSYCYQQSSISKDPKPFSSYILPSPNFPTCNPRRAFSSGKSNNGGHESDFWKISPDEASKTGSILDEDTEVSASTKDVGDDWLTPEGFETWKLGDEPNENSFFDQVDSMPEVVDERIETTDEVDRIKVEQELESEKQQLTAVLKGPDRAFGDLVAASGITDEMLDSLMALKDFSGIEGLPPLKDIEDWRYQKTTQKSARAEIERQKLEEIARARVRQVDNQGRAYGTGRRKCSVARVWIQPGDGKFSVNDKEFDVYFPMLDQRAALLRPFTETKTLGLWDVNCTVKGGGTTGQVGAVRLGISRALQNWEPGLRPALRAVGFLTRDPRAVERKKPGKAKARKSFAWVKR
ncbi:hypothetical protein QQ045_004874 [Rhodiola kirilowii]